MQSVKDALEEFYSRRSGCSDPTCGVCIRLRAQYEIAMADLEADAQALADVRTLDEWAAQPECYWSCQSSCVAVYKGRNSSARFFDGPTPDAARHAAAEWVRTETRARAAIEKADRILDAHAREQQSGSLPHVSTIGSDQPRPLTTYSRASHA